MTGLRARLLPAAALLLALGCGGAGSPGGSSEPAAPALGESDIEAWAGEGSASADAARAPSAEQDAPPPIQLATGERFEMLLALSRVRPAPTGDTHCSLYALRARGGRLEEGRATLACDADLENATVDGIAFEPVDAPRLAHLRAVLSGARPATDAVSERAKRYGDGAEYRITVRVVTSDRAIEGQVPPVEWPPPGAEQTEPALGRKPASLSEVWEAVMFPHRFVPPPA